MTGRRRLGRALGLAVGLVLAAVPARPAAKRILAVSGDVLVYSYDHGQAYGETVGFEAGGYKVTAAYFKLDVFARQALAYGGVVLIKDAERLEADELLLSLEGGAATLVRYGATIEEMPLAPAAPATDIKDGGGAVGRAAPAAGGFEAIGLDQIRKSFISFSAREIIVTDSFEVQGTGVTLYLEGIESMGFKSFRLSDGIGPRRNGFALNRVWYNKTQGLIGRASYSIDKPNKVSSLTQLNYEERSFLKNNYGIDRQVDLLTSTTLTFNDSLRLGLAGNVNSSSLWNVQAWLSKTWSPAFTTQFDFSFNKPIGYRGEAWFGLQSQLAAGRWGNLSVQGRYETRNQAVAGLSYAASFLNRFSLNLQSYYSKVRIGDSDDFSEILTGGFNLSYGSRLFNLGTDYFLNYDLFGRQVLSQPQLRIGLNPVSLYGGLLSVSLSDVALYNHLSRQGQVERSASNNTVLNLGVLPLELGGRLRLSFNLALEQFVEREGRNFTTGGVVVNAVRELWTGVSVEAYYSLSSRRRTRGWLIEGTTSQDLSLVARATAGDRINSWVSLSYDAKNGQLRHSFADLSFKVVRNWGLHAILNYDFFLKKLNNVDLYIVREAGRLQLRLIWRSLSRQFLVEFLPR
jgi:hypothetical protein